jgi:hypothetical protein
MLPRRLRRASVAAGGHACRRRAVAAQPERSDAPACSLGMADFDPLDPELLSWLANLTHEKELVARVAMREVSGNCRVDADWPLRIRALLLEVNPSPPQLDELLREADAMAEWLAVEMSPRQRCGSDGAEVLVDPVRFEELDGLEGSWSQDNVVVSKLNSLLELIGRAKSTAASLRSRLPRLR